MGWIVGVGVPIVLIAVWVVLRLGGRGRTKLGRTVIGQTVESPHSDVSPARGAPSDAEPQPSFIPVCPYCETEFKNRKRPTRRSSFKCPACKKPIAVEPKQYLYSSMYLTREQAQYVYYLWQLDRWVFAKGSFADYSQMKATLTMKFGGDPGVRDVVWGLMNESAATCGDKYSAEMIQELMDEFHRFEEEEGSTK